MSNVRAAVIVGARKRHIPDPVLEVCAGRAKVNSGSRVIITDASVIRHFEACTERTNERIENVFNPF